MSRPKPSDSLSFHSIHSIPLKPPTQSKFQSIVHLSYLSHTGQYSVLAHNRFDGQRKEEVYVSHLLDNYVDQWRIQTGLLSKTCHFFPRNRKSSLAFYAIQLSYGIRFYHLV